MTRKITAFFALFVALMALAFFAPKVGASDTDRDDAVAEINDSPDTTPEPVPWRPTP